MTDDIAQLCENFHYDSETGTFWKKVGHATGHGYQRISTPIGPISAHRLVWALVHKRWPTGDIDHINGNRSDNRLENLRDVSVPLNRQNLRGPYKNSKSELLGASWSKAMKRWTARIHYAGKHHFLGYFDSAEEAHAAYLKVKREVHPGCTI